MLPAILEVLHQLRVLVIKVFGIGPVAQMSELFLADHRHVIFVCVRQALGRYIVAFHAGLCTLSSVGS